MTGERPTGTVHVEMYVRSLRPCGSTTRTLDRVADLAADGAVGSFDVVVWGDRAPPTAECARTEMGRYVCDRIGVFSEWARRNGVSLKPGFPTERVDALTREASFEQRRLPTLVVAVYEDGGLERVVPHETTGGVLSVPAFLDRFEEWRKRNDFVPVEGCLAPAPTPVSSVTNPDEHRETESSTPSGSDDSAGQTPPRP